MILANRVAQSVVKRVLGGLGGLWVGGISLPDFGRRQGSMEVSKLRFFKAPFLLLLLKSFQLRHFTTLELQEQTTGDRIIGVNNFLS